MKLLLICVGFDTVQYRVLRCAAEIACEVHVLGTAATRRLASSRFCTRFIEASWLDAPVDAESAARHIDAIGAAHEICLVVPGDGPAVRLLGLVRQHMRLPSFPVPDHQTFDLLNDKWRFGELCGALGVRHPAERLFADAEDLHRELAGGSLPCPVVVKPVGMSGGRGVRVIRSRTDMEGVGRLLYRPILAQDYIEGDDISLNAFCRGGTILTSVVCLKRKGDCIFTSSPEFVELAGRILAHVAYDGVANFDARVDGDGRIHLLECNPRFFYTMDMVLLAGVNFVRLGSDASPAHDGGQQTVGAVLKSNRSLLRTLGRPWRITWRDLTTLRYRLRDPVPVLHELVDRLRGRRAASAVVR